MAQTLVQERFRADVYRILAACYCPPERDLLQSFDDLTPPVSEVLDEVARAVATADVESLKVEHARLFVGPFQLLAPPYGSVYLEDGALMGKSTEDVRDWYRREGVEASGESLPDHIVAELEFLHVLVLQEMEVAGVCNLSEVRRCHQKQRAFLGTHLGAWVAEFTDRLLRSTEADFYRALGRATERFVSEDVERLGSGAQAAQRLDGPP